MTLRRTPPADLPPGALVAGLPLSAAFAQSGETTDGDDPVAANEGLLLIREDTRLQGKVRNCRLLEIYGYVEGEVTVERLLVHPGGSFRGKAHAASAEVYGNVEGTLSVRDLIAIRGAGVVSGNVQYGRIAMESGATLSAEVRNVPPALAGDFELAVFRGRSVGVTMQDLTALDPDDHANDLTFTVSNARNGYIVLADAPAVRIDSFTQADLESNRVVFRHDGTETSEASFDVIVADRAGASSGAPRTVNVTVRPVR